MDEAHVNKVDESRSQSIDENRQLLLFAVGIKKAS